MKEYKLSKSQKIKEATYVIVLLSIFIGIGIYSQAENYVWLVLIIVLIMMYSVYTTLDYKIVLYNEKLSIVSFSLKKDLEISKIKKISIDGNYITLFYGDGEMFNIRNNLENHSELIKDIEIIKRKYGV